MDIENQSTLRSSELFRSFWRVNQSMRRFVHKTALENGLSIPQYALLMAIARLEETTQKQLGKQLQFPKSTLSQAVEGLVQAELISRKPVEDNRRETLLNITEKGKELCQVMQRHEGGIHQAFESATQMLSDKQMNDLIATHLQIAKVLDTELKQGKENVQND